MNAKVAWHLYLMAQPAGMPEKMIAAVAPEFFGSFLDAWDPTGTTFTPEERDHYVTSSINSVDSIVADYRATPASISTWTSPTANAGLGSPCPSRSSPRTGARNWASTPRPSGRRGHRSHLPGTTSGHFMAEENPDEIAGFITELAARIPADQPDGHATGVTGRG